MAESGKNPSREDWKGASEIISEDQIKWAIKALMALKSSGTIGVFAGLQQNIQNTSIKQIWVYLK